VRDLPWVVVPGEGDHADEEVYEWNGIAGRAETARSGADPRNAVDVEPRAASQIAHTKTREL